MIAKISCDPGDSCMRTTTLAVLLGCVLYAQAYGQTPRPTAAPESDVVKISTNLIQIDATVTDSKGNPIRDLQAADVEIYENGKKQEITAFSFVAQKPHQADAKKSDDSLDVPVPVPGLRPEQVRRTVALVVDDLSLSYESMNRTQRALRKFVDEQMAEGDLVAIIRVGVGMGALQQFTSDKRQLLSIIDKLKWNPLGRGRVGAFAPINDGPESLQKLDQDPEDETVIQQFKTSFADYQESIFATGTLGALRYVVTGLKDLPGRKSVVLFSDGIQIFQRDEHGYTNGGRVNEFLKTLIDIANRNSVTFYTMDARGLDDGVVTARDSIYPTRPPTNTKRLTDVAADRSKELFDTQDGLVHLAAETGGFPVLIQNDMNAGLKRILEDQSYYLIAYTPAAETFDRSASRFNKIEVRVLRDGAKVRYRSGFFNTQGEAAAKPTKLTPAQRLQDALTSPFGANNIGLRLNALYGNNGGGDYVTALLHVNTKDLAFSDQPSGERKAAVDVFAVTYSENGVAVDKIVRTFNIDVKAADYQRVLEKGFVCFFNFPMKKPGPYQLRVAIRDARADTVGSASQFIEVPDLKKKALTLSGIELENFSAEQWQRMTAIARSVADRSGPTEQGDPMADTSLRQFRRGTVLHYSFDVYNIGAESSGLTNRLRVFRDGKLLLDGKPVPVNLDPASGGRVRATGAMSLPPEMQPGDYVLQVIVSDPASKGKAAAQFVQFELL